MGGDGGGSGRRVVPALVSRIAIALCCGFFAAPGARAAEDAVPVFVRIQVPPDSEVTALLDRFGVHGFAVRATDQTTLESVRGAPLIVEELLPPGNLRLPPEELERYFEDWYLTRTPELTKRPSCFNREPVRSELRLAVEEAARAVRPYGPRWLLLVDDPSLTVGSEPIDWCYCDSCRAAFAEWFSSIAGRVPEADLAPPGTRGPLFAPQTVDEIRARNLDRPREKARLFPWVAYRRFLDAELARELAELSRIASRAAGVPAGFSGGAPSNPFGGHDWAALARSCDVLVPPDDPTSRSVVSSIAPPTVTRLTLLQSTGGSERVGRQKLIDQALEGSRGVLVRSLDDLIRLDGSGAASPTPLLTAIHKTTRMLANRVAPALREARRVGRDVGILYSPTSLCLLWLKDTEPDGVFWPSRAGRLGSELLPLAGTWWAWQLLVADAGFDYRYVDEAALADRNALSELSALVLPRAIVLTAAQVDAVRAFVEEGGVLICDSETGLFDEFGRGRAAGALDDLLGIRREDESRPWDWHVEEELEKGEERPRRLGLGVAEPHTAPDDGGDAPCVALERVSGRGRTLYLNLVASDYLTLRSVEHSADTAARLVDLVRRTLSRGRATPPVRVEAEDGAPARVRVRRFEDASGRSLIAVTRNEVLPEVRGLPEARIGVRRYRILLPSAGAVEDLWGGREFPEGEPIEVDLAPDDLVLLRADLREGG